jgi:hypothetical protein
MIRKGLLLVISLMFFSFPFTGAVFAQTAGQISTEIIPPNPGPNEMVTIYLKSFSFNINTADIEWSVDGKKISGGVGATSFKTTTKGLGGSTIITAVIIPTSSIPITKTISITPMSVDLLWQATDSIVPPFYRGKAMPTSESKLKIVALPQIVSLAGSLISPENLMYSWKEEYQERGPNSGYGKNVFSTEMDYLNDTKQITVDVSSRDGGSATSGSIEIIPTNPEIRLYASSPLYGPLTDKALTDSYTVENSDTSIIAMPYFFSPGNPSSSLLEYKWQLNGSPIDTPSTPNSLFLHRESGAAGSATLDLAINNITKLFQTRSIHLNLSLQ